VIRSSTPSLLVRAPAREGSGRVYRLGRPEQTTGPDQPANVKGERPAVRESPDRGHGSQEDELLGTRMRTG
jgi:hypothetical protein